jgi:hypothetical protein
MNAPRSRRARFLATLLVQVAAATGPTRAAHEWRTAWAEPHAIGVAESLVAADPESVRAEVGLARPFGMRELASQGATARVGAGAWEVHAGVLRGPGYREWHAGLARRLRPRAAAGALVGLRVFGAGARGAPCPLRFAASALLRILPAGARGPWIEAGVVDLGFARAPDAPAPVLLARTLVSGGGRRVLIERSIAARGEGETTLALAQSFSRIRAGCAARLGSGETSVALTLPGGPAEVTVIERWHPALGWTPALAVRWRRRPSDRR